MRQLTFVEPGKLEWWDVPVPQLQSASDALVRPLTVARCDLDRFIFTGRAPFPGPFAFGHEMIGEVVDVGSSVSGFVPGDRVVVPFQISCGQCDACRRGWTNACQNVPRRASFGMKPLSGVEFGGALSELLLVPFADHMLVKVPASLSPVAFASLADNLPDGWRSVAPHLAKSPGADVLIMGGDAQSVGLYAVTAARALGAGRVVYADHDPVRLRAARAAGAEVLEVQADDATAPLGVFPITVDATGNAAALRLALRSTAPNGVCTSVAIYYEDQVALPLLYMYGAGISFHTGRVHAREEIPHVLECAQCGHLHPETLEPLCVPFSQAADAMGDGTPKVVFLNDLT